jgi:hypothetical protein
MFELHAAAYSGRTADAKLLLDYLAGKGSWSSSASDGGPFLRLLGAENAILTASLDWPPLHPYPTPGDAMADGGAPLARHCWRA